VLLAGAVTVLAQQPAQPAAEDSRTVTANGASTYRQDDLARSREEAIEAARRDAVEQVMGVFISSESEMKNFDLVKDEVLSKTQGFVKRSKVVKEGRDGPMFQVTIEAEVSKGAFLKEMNDSLEGLYRRVGKPRVMLVIQERADNSGAGLNAAEKEIRKILLAQGFTFVDPKVLTRAQMADLEARGKDVDKDTLIRLGQSTKAEILITGQSRTSSKGEFNRFSRVQADVSLDVLKTDNGQIMASEVHSALGLHIAPETAAMNAIQKAAQEITPKIMQQVTYQWIKDKNEGARLEMTVRNTSFGDLVNLRRSLGNSVRGVKKVTQRSFSQGTAMLELETRDPAERVAESISETQFQGFSLEIVDVTSTSLIVNMKKKP
jgi:hypothetical protein